MIEKEYDSASDLSQKMEDTAKEYQANGIIVGSRGLSPVRRLYLGSVSTTILNESTLPVTIVKQPSPTEEPIPFSRPYFRSVVWKAPDGTIYTL